MLSYPFNFEKIIGRFLERKNRFIVSAYVDNKLTNCYLPNPGRLFELLIPNETELILVRNHNSKELPFIVLACKKGDNWVLVHTHITNKIVKDLINRGLIYEGFQVVAEEIKVGNGRIDLLLSNGNQKIYLEIKTCTLFGQQIAMFPDAVTTRGKKHLLELRNLNNNGIMNSVLFVVMNPDVKIFLPAYHIDFEFAKTFIEVKDSVDIKAVGLGWDSNFSYVQTVRELKIPFSFIEKELKDRGVYILVTYLDKDELISIGAHGKMQFPSGYYAYVGRAKRGLFKRIERHKKKHKQMHWHIDYFLGKAKIIKDLPIITNKDIECIIADNLSKISDEVIPNFGSSDCHCDSHLFYFRENPLYKRNFIEMVTYFRLDFIEI